MCVVLCSYISRVSSRRRYPPWASVCVVDGRVELELRLAEGIKFYLNRMRAIISLWLKIYNFGQFLRQLVTIVVRLHSRSLHART